MINCVCFYFDLSNLCYREYEFIEAYVLIDKCSRQWISRAENFDFGVIIIFGKKKINIV